MRKKKRRTMYRCTVILTLMLALALLPAAVFAGEGTEAPVSADTSAPSPEQLGIYLIPRGEHGTDNGNLWLYTEVYDAEGNTLQQDGWTLSVSVVYVAQEPVVASMTDAGNGAGYLWTPFDLVHSGAAGGQDTSDTGEGGKQEKVTEEDYQNCSVTVMLLNGEDILLTRTDSAWNCIKSWPHLKTEKWTASGDDAEKKPSIVFDWEDSELFSRIFTVELEELPASVEARKLENTEIWELSILRDTDAVLKVRVTDLLDNSQETGYSLRVDMGSSNFLMICILLAVLLGAGGIILAWRYHRRKGGESPEVPPDHIKSELIQQQENLRRKYNELKEACRELSMRQEDYRRQQQILDRQSGGFRTDTVGMDVLLRTESLDEMPEVRAYHEAIEQIRIYERNYEEYSKKWKKPETQQKMTTIYRDLADKNREIREKISRLEERISARRMEVEEERRHQAERENCLGRTLRVTVCMDQTVYRVNKGAADEGFSLDDCHPIVVSEGYAVSSRTIRQLAGASSGIRFYAGGDGAIRLVSEGEHIHETREDGSADERQVRGERILPAGRSKQLYWKRENAGTVEITVE